MKPPGYDFIKTPLSTLRRLWVMALLTLVFQSLPVRADTAALAEIKTNFSFVDGAAITVSPGSAGALKFDAAIKNSGVSGAATTALIGDGCAQTEASPLASEKLDALKTNAVAVVTFTISGVTLPRSCYVELVSEGGTSLKQIKLTQSYATCTVMIFLLTCLLVSSAVAYCASRRATVQQSVNWKFQLGNPAWDFAKSWTSTTTLVGGIISTALALSALPELTKYASKSGYSVLALLISLVVIVAPFIFSASMVGKVHREKQGKYSVEYKGRLWIFTISCAVTLFAGLAQLFVFFFLLHEIFHGYFFWPSLEAAPFVNLGLLPTVILAAVLCCYARHSILLTVELQEAADTNAAELTTVNGAKDEAQREHVGSPMLTWPVL